MQDRAHAPAPQAAGYGRGVPYSASPRTAPPLVCQFADHYYETIVKRLNDAGISVRKRVIKILRDLVLKQPTGKRAVDVCCRLVSRVARRRV